MNKVVVIIPAYNEEKTVGQVVKNVLESCRKAGNPAFAGNPICLVVDDGSIDKTAQVAREAGAVVLSHPINRGLGAALATGIEGALRIMNYELGIMNHGIVVTLDADGQHDPVEIPKLIEPIIKGEADVVIGSRFLLPQHYSSPLVGEERRGGVVPKSRRLANWCGNLFTWLLFGVKVTDSQSGFRAFSAEAARKIKIRTNTMEVSSEIIREIKLRGLRFKEVSITPIYTDYSLSKGQGFLQGLETLWKLIVLRFFR